MTQHLLRKGYLVPFLQWNEETGHVCPECGKCFNTTRHHAVRDGCGHIKCLVDLLIPIEQCKQCKAKATSPKKPSTLEERKIPDHVQVRTTPEGFTWYKCTVCVDKKEFKTKAHAFYHEFCKLKKDGVNVEKLMPFFCQLCNRGFITNVHFSYHVQTEHFPPKFPCDESQKNSSTASKRKVILKKRCRVDVRVAAADKRKFCCLDCGSKFVRKDYLTRHRKYRCPKIDCVACDRKFLTYEKRQEHVRNMHKDELFPCLGCTRLFIKAENIAQHYKMSAKCRGMAKKANKAK